MVETTYNNMVNYTSTNTTNSSTTYDLERRYVVRRRVSFPYKSDTGLLVIWDRFDRNTKYDTSYNNVSFSS